MASCRLTLTGGIAITTANVSGALAVYLTPAMGQTLPLFDGSDFVQENVGGELMNVGSDASYSPAAMAASSCYYNLLWKDGLTFRLSRSPAWLSDINPGTGAGTAEAELFGGHWVNKYAVTNGPAARRGLIVGGVRSNASAQMEDTSLRRCVSNTFNACPRLLRVTPASPTWNYATASWRFAENDPANVVDWFHAFDGSRAEINIQASARADMVGSIPLIGIGFDGCLPSILDTNGSIQSVAVANLNIPLRAASRKYCGLGRHYAGWYEYVTNGGTATYLSGAISGLYQSGLYGEVMN
ncbi:MAG: hypothetical protein WC670_09670 [Pseudolabrys sp.]|jgi:hypothetical protein